MHDHYDASTYILTRRTSHGNITRSVLYNLPRPRLLVRQMRHLNDVRDGCIVRDAHSLNIDGQTCSGAFEIWSTFGLPVVPLEKLRNASLVLPSPCFSLRSVKHCGFSSPSFTSSCSVSWLYGDEAVFSSGSNSTTRSGGKPAALAAAIATG